MVCEKQGSIVVFGLHLVLLPGSSRKRGTRFLCYLCLHLIYGGARKAAVLSEDFIAHPFANRNIRS